MDKFIRNLEDLPKAWQEEINEGLQKYIVTQANYTREDLPSEFLAYIDGEIAKAKASMQKMVEASGYKYAYCNGFYKYVELPRKARFVSQYFPREAFERMLKLLEANNLEYQLKYLPEKVRL